MLLFQLDSPDLLQLISDQSLCFHLFIYVWFSKSSKSFLVSSLFCDSSLFKISQWLHFTKSKIQTNLFLWPQRLRSVPIFSSLITGTTSFPTLFCSFRASDKWKSPRVTISWHKIPVSAGQSPWNALNYLFARSPFSLSSNFDSNISFGMTDFLAMLWVCTPQSFHKCTNLVFCHWLRVCIYSICLYLYLYLYLSIHSLYITLLPNIYTLFLFIWQGNWYRVSSSNRIPKRVAMIVAAQLKSRNQELRFGLPQD